jgi:hypothetical protein
MTEEEEELPCFSALLDSGSEPRMTLTLLELAPSWLSPLRMTAEDERVLSASDGDHESSSPHATKNATTLNTTKNFFTKT